MRDLRKSQLAALAFVGERASAKKSAARRKAEDVLNEDGGTFDETLQYLKQMWHVLAAFGKAGFT